MRLVALVALLALPAAPLGCERDDRAPPRRSAPAPAMAFPTPADRALARAVREELAADALADYDAVVVDAEAGIVSLRGEVHSALAKERTQRLAETVKGVRGVSNRLAVRVPPRDDADLARDLERALALDAALDAQAIHIAVDEATATLTGQVVTWHDRSLAGRIAKAVPGIADVDNRLRVRRGPERSDAEIAHDIESRLRWDVRAAGDSIEVSVEGGHVRLSGTVPSLAAKGPIEAAAWVAGVRSVRTAELEVKPEPSAEPRAPPSVHSDQQIRGAILAAARDHPRLGTTALEVEVSLGVVTLAGTVDHPKAQHAARELAMGTLGVAEVIDRIEVEPPRPVPDEQLAREVQAFLAVNVVTEGYPIAVSADRGAIRLTGTVDSFFEKAEAGDLASAVAGVRSVDNRLAVSEPERPFVHDPWLVPLDPYPPTVYVAPHTERSDADIAQSIRSQLSWDTRTSAFDIDVRVEDGTAVLSGEVDGLDQSARAEQNAYEGGAIEVINLIGVRG